MTDAAFKTNLNWITDDGINLAMINDVVRNSFYNKILANTVENKHCCDVGFGTGLLSILALMHGAKSVIAYEKNQDRFELGQLLIDRLKLSNKITLINSLATSEHIQSDNCDVIFHEIVHQALWGEGLWYIRPKIASSSYVPGNYFLEIYANEISDSIVDGFINSDYTLDYFNPGIPMPPEFINLVNNVMLGNSVRDLKPVDLKNYLVRTNWNQIHKYWSANPMHVFSKYTKSLVASYDVDYNSRQTLLQDSLGNRTLDFDTNIVKLSIDSKEWKNKNIMFEVKFGLRHGQEKLYLDHCRGWGQEAPWLFIKPESNLEFRQNFSNGVMGFQCIS